MSKRLLFGVIVVLIITNVATLLFLDKEKDTKVHVDDESEKTITSKERVAKVGDKEIVYEDWIASLQKAYGEKHLKEMIDRELVEQLAEENNIQINEKLIEREIYYLATMQGIMSKSEIEKEEKKWRENALFRYQLEELLVGDVNIPEQEIRNHYNTYRSQYDFKASMQFSHIIVDDFEIADKVLEELDSGASFHLLAQEYSNDDETKNIGGYLGYYTKTSQFIPHKYFEIAESMEEHSYSDPFQTDNGVAIIYLHRDLPSVTFTYDEIKQHIKNELALKELEQPLTTKPLWEQRDIEWIYE